MATTATSPAWTKSSSGALAQGRRTRLPRRVTPDRMGRWRASSRVPSGVNLEVAAHDAPLIDTAVTLAAQPLVAWGSPDQREFFLPRIIAGELIVCIAYTEADAGSDLGNLAMTAEPDGTDSC